MSKKIESIKLEFLPKRPYWVYILECSDLTYYTGITNNLCNRLIKHNSGTASKYTRNKLPVKFVFYKIIGSKSEALIFESKIKKMTRNKKEKLIKDHSLGGY